MTDPCTFCGKQINGNRGALMAHIKACSKGPNAKKTSGKAGPSMNARPSRKPLSTRDAVSRSMRELLADPSADVRIRAAEVLLQMGTV